MTEKDKEADGLYFQKPSQSSGSVLHADIREVKDNIQELSQQLKNFTIPTTVGVTVTVDLGFDKKMSTTTTRQLAPGETVFEGHERLYKECLESIAKLVN
jgi:hypothetical protein